MSAALSILGREMAVADWLPFRKPVNETIIANHDGTLISMFRIRGRAHECASPHDVHRWVTDLNALLIGIATPHLAFWSHLHHHPVEAFPSAEYENEFCADMNRRYRAKFEGRSLMSNSLYLTVVYRPVADAVLRAMARFEKRSPAQIKALQDGAVKRLSDINATITKSLSHYGAELMALEPRGGKMFSPQIEWLAYILNGEHHPMPVTRDDFNENMPQARPLFSRHGELGELRQAKRSRVFGMVEVKDFTGSLTSDDAIMVEPGQMNALMRMDFEYILTHSFTCYSRSGARDMMKRQRKVLADSGDSAESEITQIGDALDKATSGKIAMGDYHGTCLVFGETAEQTQDRLAQVQSTLLNCGVVPNVCGINLEAAFRAQFPANWRWIPRPLPVSSPNFLCFSPFHNFMTGKATGNPWGDAVTLFRTPNRTPLYFNFHASAPHRDETGERRLGNTLILGKSGEGKTVLLGHLLAQAQKFRPKVVAFDIDQGLSVATRAMGGRYNPLRFGVPTQWNPFALPAMRPNIEFLRSLMKACGTRRDAPLTAQDEDQIDRALSAVMTLPPEQRNFTTFSHFIDGPVRQAPGAPPSLASRLRKWCRLGGQEGENGWLFDNPGGTLDLSAGRMFGFDVTEFLEMPGVRDPLMMYLLHSTEQMIDGSPFMLIFDECWKALEDPTLVALIKDKQKTGRKENVISVLASQEPNDALASPIGKTIAQQAQSLLLLHNPAADHADYVDGLKLTESEFEAVLDIPEGSRRFLYKQGMQAGLGEIDLEGMGDVLDVLSGTPDRAMIAERLIEETGDDPALWLPEYIRRVRREAA